MSAKKFLLKLWERMILAFITVACITIVIKRENLQPTYSDVGLPLAGNEEPFAQQDQPVAEQGYDLKIIPVNHWVSDHRIRSLLATIRDNRGAVMLESERTGPYNLAAPGTDDVFRLGHSYLEGYAPFATNNIMVPMMTLAQRKQYMLDHLQYRNRREVWQSSRQSYLYPRGDCEDHALLITDWLIEMGEDARVVVGHYKNQGHAWVVLFKNGREYLIEATSKQRWRKNQSYPLAALQPLYQPSYMFNREYFWRNNELKKRTDYSGSHWQKVSYYQLRSSQSDI